MDIRALPRYRGRREPKRGWAEPDGHGHRCGVRLRDWVALAVILGFVVPLVVCYAAPAHDRARRVMFTDELRIEGMDRHQANDLSPN
jgi:hypothetical protein